MREIILNYVENLDNLPKLPEVSLEIMKSLQSEETSLNEAVQVIRRDPSLVLRIMKVANSARFGGAMKVTALEVAAGRLGMEMLKQLSLIDGISSLFPNSKGGYDSRNYWEHSICTAFTAEKLRSKIDPNIRRYMPKKIECFTAALLHGVGMLLLQMGFSESTPRIIQYMQCEGLTLLETEKQIIGISNAECGEILCSSWKLPPAIIAAVRWHQSPQQAPEEHRCLCELTYIAKYIALQQTTNESIFTPTSLEYLPEIFNKYGLDAISQEEMSSIANQSLENSMSVI